MEKTAFTTNFGHWENEFKKLFQLVKSDGDDFPSDDSKFQRLLRYTESHFNEPWLTIKTNKIDQLMRIWAGKEKSRRIKQEGEPPKEQSEDTMPAIENPSQLGFSENPPSTKLEHSVATSIHNLVTKIACQNNIQMADKVSIKLTAKDGIITFKGIE